MAYVLRALWKIQHAGRPTILTALQDFTKTATDVLRARRIQRVPPPVRKSVASRDIG